MNKLKHSKFKNTAFLFEVLSRKVVSEALDVQRAKGTALNLVKKHFNKNSFLLQELELYNSILRVNRKIQLTNPTGLIDLVVEAQSKLNKSELGRAKYNLVKDLKKNYGDNLINEMFAINVSNYKELASIYKLFEYKAADNPVEIHSARNSICEYLQKPLDGDIKNTLATLPKDVREVAFRKILESFNEKYKGFSRKQKELLNIYINHPELLKDHIKTEAASLNKNIPRLIENIDSDSLRVKLESINGYLKNIANENKITDDHVSAMLKYYSLVLELKKYA